MLGRRVRARLQSLAACAACLAGTIGSARCLAETRVPFEQLYRQAYELRLGESGPEHPRTIASLVRLGALLRAHGRPSEAEPLLRKALESQGRLSSDGANILLELGETVAAMGRASEAEALYLRSLELVPAGSRGARTLLKIAALREQGGDQGGARQAYNDALEHFEKAGPLPEEEQEARATALNNLGLLLETAGETELAEATYRRSAQAHVEALGDRHPATAAARANLAGMLALRGEAADAAELLEDSLAVIRAAYGPSHDDTARLHNRLGEIYEVLGRLAGAKTQYLAALAAWDQPSASRGMALADLGRLAGVQGDLGAAESALAEAIRDLRAHAAGSYLDLAEALDSYGSVLRGLGRLGEAEQAMSSGLAIRERELGTDHSEVALSLVGLASVLHLRGSLAQAEPLYRRALDIQEQALGPSHPEVGETLYNIGHLKQALGSAADARDAFERSAGILSEAYGHDDPFVAEVRAALRAVR